jgi:hypothetical protein
MAPGRGAALSQLEAGEEALRGWLLDASAIKAPLQQLILDWTSERDGFQRFSIEASDDLQHWQSWGEGQVARLTFADERVEQHEVGLPGQSARYLRCCGTPVLGTDPHVGAIEKRQPAACRCRWSGRSVGRQQREGR